MAALFGVRADFGDAFVAVLLKVGFGLAAAAAAAPLLLELARPNTRARHVAIPAFLFAAASTAIAFLAFLVTPAEARMESWLGGGVPECLYRIPLLAAPIAIALFLAVRGLGPTRLSLAGAAIGAVSGSLAAIAYASCCPMDSALYVASWYLAAILFCAAVGAVLVGRALKW
ncbi:MAG TPA: anti-sigma F factor [Hyphomonadaceae bacterium]|nr:anti-sigma F factor [Hyphomonadaceae bacterium]